MIILSLRFKLSNILTQAGDGETYLYKETTPEDPTLGGSCQQIYGNKDDNYSSFIEGASEVHQQMGTIADEAAVGKWAVILLYLNIFIDKYAISDISAICGNSNIVG